VHMVEALYSTYYFNPNSLFALVRTDLDKDFQPLFLPFTISDEVYLQLILEDRIKMQRQMLDMLRRFPSNVIKTCIKLSQHSSMLYIYR